MSLTPVMSIQSILYRDMMDCITDMIIYIHGLTHMSLTPVMSIQSICL